MSDYEDESVEWQEVKELIPHENYIGHEADIGLIKLEKEIVFNGNVQPVNLPTNDNINGNFTAVLIGWGAISVSEILHLLSIVDEMKRLFRCLSKR